MNRQQLRRLIESEVEEQVGEEEEDQEERTERVRVKNNESGNTYSVRQDHAFSNPQKYSSIRRMVREVVNELLSKTNKTMNKRQLKRIIREETRKQMNEDMRDTYQRNDEFATKVSQTQRRMDMEEIYVSTLNDKSFAFMIQSPEPKFKIKPFERQMGTEVTIVSVAADGSLYIGGRF